MRVAVCRRASGVLVRRQSLLCRPLSTTGQYDWSTLSQLGEQSCFEFADRNLFGIKDLETKEFSWMTYKHFHSRVHAFRASLAAEGLTHGDCVAIVSNNRQEWAVAAYASYGLGLPVVPMYPQQLPEEWEYIIRDSDAKLVCVSTLAVRDKLSTLPDIGSRKIVCFEDYDRESPDSFENWVDNGYSLTESGVFVPGAGSAEETGRDVGVGIGLCTDANVSPDDIATLIYTSGTTGRPKGVMLSHNNLCSNVKAMRDIAGKRMNQDTVTLSFLPWAHVSNYIWSLSLVGRSVPGSFHSKSDTSYIYYHQVYGQTMELHKVISAGGAMGIAESSHTVLDDIAKVKPNLLVAVPVVYNKIYDAVKRRLAEGSPHKQKLFNMAMEVARERREWFDDGKTGPNPWLWLRWNLFQTFVFSSVTRLLGGNLKIGFTGGAALSPVIQQWFADIGIPLLEGYGLTETSPVVASERFGPTEATQGGLRAVGGVRILICNQLDDGDNDKGGDEDGGGGDDLTEVSNLGDEGEICVLGPNVMVGYHNNKEATAEALGHVMVDGQRAVVFRTGDLGKLDSAGVLSITGRANEQYKLENGKFVVPGPIEDKFRLWSPYVQQCYVHGLNRPHNVMLVVPDFEACASELGLPPPPTPEERERSHEDAYAEMSALANNPKVVALLEVELQKAGSKMGKSYALPRTIAVIGEPFSVETGLLTPKLSMKRRAIADRYAQEIEALYN